MPQIILASGSKNRQTLLKTLGIPFKIVTSDFDEKQVDEKRPAERAKKIAWGKAKIVAAKYPKDIIISADTFTICQGKIWEKPKNLDEAKYVLKQLSGRNAISYTGFCFLNPKKKIKFLKTVATKIKFRKIYDSEIEAYVKKFPVTTWAAAYATSELYVEGLLTYIEGSMTGFSHGLPTEFLIPLLAKSGYYPRPK